MCPRLPHHNDGPEQVEINAAAARDEGHKAVVAPHAVRALHSGQLDVVVKGRVGAE